MEFLYSPIKLALGDVLYYVVYSEEKVEAVDSGIVLIFKGRDLPAASIPESRPVAGGTSKILIVLQLEPFESSVVSAGIADYLAGK